MFLTETNLHFSLLKRDTTLFLLKFGLRLIICLCKLLFICIPLEILGWLVLLPACYFSKSSKLPWYLKWYDNADIYIGRDASTYMAVVDLGWKVRYQWLAFRNPLNYFGYVVLGMRITDKVLVSSGNMKYTVGDSFGKVPGFLWTETTEGYYEYYYIHKWSEELCFRFRMGHKIGQPESNSIGSSAQWVMAIQPLKSYSGV